MADKVTCPSCNDGKTKRLSDVILQQAKEGVKGSVGEQYVPPREPWGYVQGFLLAVPINAALMIYLGPSGPSEGEKAMMELLTTVVFLGVWVGFGVWKKKAYTKQLEDWKRAIAAKLHCLKCGHVFEG